MPDDHPSSADSFGQETRARGITRFRTPGSKLKWWRRYRFAVHLAGCFFAVTLSAYCVEALNNSQTGTYYIWVANGLLLSYLLLAPRWRWPAYLCAGFAGYLASALLSQKHWQPIVLFYNVLDIADVLIAALLLRRRSTQLPHFTNRGYLLRFIGYAVVTAPVATGLIYTLVSVVLLHSTPRDAFLSWTAVDSLGIIVVTPACVAIFRTGFGSSANLRNNCIYLFLLAGITALVFAQTTVPLLMVIYPLLVLILMEMGLGWAAMSMLLVAMAGGWFSIRGSGPFVLPKQDLGPGISFRLQVFVASAMVMLYFVSIVLERQRAIDKRLRKIVAQHTLVTENSRDVIILANLKGHRSYISPAAEILTGWKTEELLKQSSTELVHPDDLKKVRAVVYKLYTNQKGVRFECRIRKADGEYIWVEARLRVAHDPDTDAPSGILNLVRDIQERKHAEQQLADAYRTVEALAVMDDMTGLSNRRRFDQYLATEWRRAQRDREPISMLLIDADLFKSYNDTYGHLRGDWCLKQIAESALDVVTRPGDLVARIGGEEFAIILPNTHSQGATQVAGEVCESLRQRKLSHESSPFGMMTVSVGCATIVPVTGQQATNLIEMSDKALYMAKRSGRNRVCSGNDVDPMVDRIAEEAGGKTA